MNNIIYVVKGNRNIEVSKSEHIAKLSPKTKRAMTFSKGITPRSRGRMDRKAS